jgi:hypothetical protein
MCAPTCGVTTPVWGTDGSGSAVGTPSASWPGGVPFPTTPAEKKGWVWTANLLPLCGPSDGSGGAWVTGAPATRARL